MGGKKPLDNLSIRPMVPADISYVIDIDERLSGLQRTADQAEVITSDIGGEYDLSLVAEYNSNVIGFLIARQVYVGEPVMETTSIRIIGVDPDYSRHGVATKLVDALMELCRSKGISAVRVMVSERDSKLEDFFKHSGFKPARLMVYSKTV
jgi:ribosomal protein S18 acetylase RimI-like enzyme